MEWSSAPSCEKQTTANTVEWWGWKCPPIGRILPVFDLNAKHRKLCQTPPPLLLTPFKQPPLFFYNPLLLSLSLCVALKEPLSITPPLTEERVVKCWWSPAQQSVAHLSSFNSLSRGMRRSQGAWALRLFKTQLAPKSIFCVYLFAHSQKKKQLFVQPTAS